MSNMIILPYLNNEEYRLTHGKDIERYKENIHHILARSRGWTNTSENLIKLFEPLHDALHRVFGNATFREQIKRLLDINRSALTHEIIERIEDIIKIEEDGYYFNKGVRREKSLHYHKEAIQERSTK